MNKCVIALQEKDVDGLDRTAGAIRGRAARVVHVVTSEMDNYEPGVYTEKVLEATKLLTNTGNTKTHLHVITQLIVCISAARLHLHALKYQYSNNYSVHNSDLRLCNCMT